MRLPSNRPALALALIAALAACGGMSENADSAAVPEETAAAAPAEEAAPAAQPTQSSSAPLTVADFDRWQRGMAAELEEVKAAGEKLRSAKNDKDSLAAIFAGNEMSTRDAGARAAGLDPERYQFVRTTLAVAVAQLTPLEQEINTKDMPASMLDEYQKNRQAALDRMSTELPPDVVEALRPRAIELRKQSMALTEARMRAAGLVR